MRLIDADALKRKAQKLSVEAWKTNRVARVNNVLNQFIDWIDDAPTIDAESKWTPVSEGLPKKKGYYLVTRKNPKGHVTKVLFDPSKVERGVYNSPWGNGDSDVLAWAELPIPYEVR